MTASLTLMLTSWALSVGAAAPAPIAVLADGPAEARAVALAEAAGGVTVSVDELDALAPGALLVLLDAQRFPAPALEQVIAHLDRAGHLLVVGGPAFDVLLVEGPDGAWVTMEERLAAVPTPHALASSDDIAGNRLLHLASGLPGERTSVAPESDGLRLQADFENAAGWCSMTFAASPPPADHNVVRIRADLGGVAEKLVVEVREQDGSRWLASASPVEGSDAFVLHAKQFAFWTDSSSQGRGGQGDYLRLSQAESVAIGFASTHQVIVPGMHELLLRSVETGALAGEEASNPTAPPLEGLCPAYKVFTTTPVRLEGVGPLRDVRVDAPGSVVSPIARPMVPHPELDTVWQPLLKGFDAKGRWSCTPVSTTWRADGATWTFVGLESQTRPLAAFARHLAETLPAGMPDPGPSPALREPPTSGARITVADGRFQLDGEPWFAHGINFWPLYVSGLEPMGYYSHWLSERFYIPELIDLDLDLLAEMGVNLVSIQYSRAEEAPQLRDFLARCHDRGIFANIWVAEAHPTSPSGSDDLSQRPFVDLIRAADLQDVPSVFGYDLAWEPALGPQDQRAQYDALFAEWIIEQYGSIDRAEEVWRCPANRNGDGAVAGPTDAQVVEDGPHRLMMAAYRRFADDLVSRRYRRVIELFRAYDDSHLFGTRTGLGGTGTMSIAPRMPYQLTSGGCHLDFVSPEGWGYTHANIADAAFVTQYARWAGAGKPVFWAEFGLTVWQGGDALAEIQGEVYDAYRVMLERTHADGWAGWWFPGGYRVDERSDYGVINPDRSLRPAAQLIADSASALKRIGPYPDPDETLVVHRDEHPAGLAFLVNDRREAFGAAWEAGRLVEIRTPGTGATSADCPLTGVGGVPFEAPQPPQYLNAEIAEIERIGSDEVRVVVVNTGEATWLARDCGLMARDAGGAERIRPLPHDVPRFGRAEMIVTAAPGATLAVTADRFGPFGERRRTP